MTLKRRTLILATAATLSAVSGCATTAPPASVIETAARAPELSTLAKLIESAGLSEALRGAGPFTLFAPNDEAFKAVPAKTLAAWGADKELLKSVLSYHVLAARLPLAEARNASLKTLQGANVSVAKAGNFVTVEDALVTQADVSASNGVIHIVDKVLIPPKR